MWQKKKFDIVVVGGGPAGATFAQRTASKGLSVLLLDKKKRIGTPVRCGEAVAAEDFHALHKPQKNWIRTNINTFCLIPPNGDAITIDLKQTGYILNRSIFDNDLVKFAEQAGATVVTNAYVNAVIIEDDFVTGVNGLWNDEPFSVQSKLVIGADGVEGRIGRFAGIKSQFSLKDLIAGYEITVSNVDIDENTCYFYVSNKVAPGGYAWVFPRSATEANIGIGISGKKYEEDNSAKVRLDGFLRKNFPKHKEEAVTMGGIILAKPLKKIVTNGLLLIGDAARTVDPVSGGGIIWGMKSAVYAADVSVNLLKNGKEPNEDNLFDYQEMWMNNEGKQVKRLYRFKDAIYNLNDGQLNNIAGKINKLPAHKKTLFNVFRITFQNKPALLLDIAKQFVGI